MNASNRHLVRVRAGILLSWGLVLVLGAGPASGVDPAGAAQPDRQAVNPDAQTMAAFTERAKAYADLHRKVEATLPKLATEATPEAIDKHQREFAARLTKARPGASHGDLFTPDMRRLVRTLIRRVFKDPQSRRQLRDAIMEDNPVRLKLTVNGRYPDAVPLSTMPPEILEQLPKLPEELEYRFVGETLILLDPDAHIIVDYIERALPR